MTPLHTYGFWDLFLVFVVFKLYFFKCRQNSAVLGGRRVDRSLDHQTAILSNRWCCFLCSFKVGNRFRYFIIRHWTKLMYFKWFTMFRVNYSCGYTNPRLTFIKIPDLIKNRRYLQLKYFTRNKHKKIGK